MDILDVVNVLNNADPLVIIPLIRKLPFATLSYTIKRKKHVLEPSKYIGYFGQSTEHALH